MPSRPSSRVAHPLVSRWGLRRRPASYGPATGSGEETAIARFVFGGPGTVQAIAPLVVEVRAVSRGNHHAYRIADSAGTTYRPLHPVSSLPLTFGELIEQIEGSGPRGGEGGLVLPVLARVFGIASGRRPASESAGDRSALVDAARSYVRAESEVYPELGGWLAANVDAWLVGIKCLAHVPEWLNHCVNRWEPRGLLPMAGSSPVGRAAEVIEEVVISWWRDQPAPADIEGMLDLARSLSRLRSALKTYVSRHGALPRTLTAIDGPVPPVDLEPLKGRVGMMDSGFFCTFANPAILDPTPSFNHCTPKEPGEDHDSSLQWFTATVETT
jgi:hypothetical protein